MLDIFSLQGNTPKRVSAKDLGRKGRYWIDATGITKDEADLLKRRFSLHHLTVEDFMSARVRIKVEEFPEYLFCVFYTVQKGQSVETVELDLVIGREYVITNHTRSLASADRLKKDMPLLQGLAEKGLDFIFHHVLDEEVDNFFPVMTDLDERIERLEEKVALRPSPALLTEILAMKRQVVRLKKIALPQREKISFLAKREYPWFGKQALPYLRDIYDHSIRVADSMDSSREAIGNAFDVYMSAQSNNMNDVMKTLSIIATIALPLTVVSGIYGTNFAILPGAGVLGGFWVMIIAMCIMAGTMLLFFRRRGWF